MGFMDKLKHQAEELMGKGKEAVGDATNNDSLAGDGTSDKLSGQFKQGADGLKDKASGLADDAKDKFSGN